MGSAFAFFSGRRGEIAWQKERFMGGRGRRDYDTHWAFGFVAPFVVLEPLHTFHWSQQGAGRAIRLNPQRTFRLRAYLQDWSVAAGLLLLFAAPATALFALYHFIEQDQYWAPLLLLAIVCLVGLVSCIFVWLSLRRGDVRDQKIRLLLGPHTWGSSDPAYWHSDLLDEVKPAKAFRVKTFEELARRYIAERKWCEAAWAARLCTALEDESLGEGLTSQILDTPQVQTKLGKARTNPSRRNAIFGEPPPLSTWVQGVLEKHVFRVGG